MSPSALRTEISRYSRDRYLKTQLTHSDVSGGAWTATQVFFLRSRNGEAIFIGTKITAFEAGKAYHYGVYVTAYTADISPDATLKINGQEVNYTRIGDDGDTQSFWVETELTDDTDGRFPYP